MYLKLHQHYNITQNYPLLLLLTKAQPLLSSLSCLKKLLNYNIMQVLSDIFFHFNQDVVRLQNQLAFDSLIICLGPFD